MVSDMTDINGVDVAFEYGEPFRPFEQLLAVLPSASHKLLPAPFFVRFWPWRSVELGPIFQAPLHADAEAMLAVVGMWSKNSGSLCPARAGLMLAHTAARFAGVGGFKALADLCLPHSSMLCVVSLHLRADTCRD
jgi:hypothetical protein